MKLKILYLLMLHAIIGCDAGNSRWPVEKFERTKWAQTSEKNRFVYVRDLIEKKILLGAPKEKIINLLGTPSYERPDGTYAVYIVRYDSGLVYVLDLRFQEINKKMFVSKIFIRSD
jgi:hypothetical protein